MPHEGDPDEKQGSSSDGKPPCGIEVHTMPKKGRRKPQKKQRRDVLDRIAHLAAATYWVVRLILLVWERFAG